MSVALYRKYRPGTFAEVRGQEHATEPLRQALRNGRVHHAYLFSGPRGCGKTSSARILARSLNCTQGPTPEPCGECEPCVALGPTGPGSIDVIEIDAASHGGVDDARDLRERAFFSPAASRYKVYVIDEAHMVTREGFNALLKLVEEPPPHLKFVFATTEPDKVISTIRSRTHHYPFRLLPPSLLRELLADVCAQEGIEVEPAALPLVVRAGAGSVRDALSILDQILAGAEAGKVTYAQAVGLLGYTDASLLDEVVEAFAAGNGGAVFEAVNRVVEGGHDPRRFATDLLERFRDLVVLRSVPDAGTKGLLDHPPDQLERMATQASRMGSAELSRAADTFHAGLIEMRGATSPRLLLELICARVLLPGAGTDEAALLSRLERVERRMSIGAPPANAPAEGHRPGHAPRDESVGGQPAGAEPAPTPHRATSGARPAAGDAMSGAAGDGLSAGPSPPAPAAEPAEPAAGPAAEPRAESVAEPADVPAEPAAGQGPPELDVAAVRHVWPDVLEDVKTRRRVAWMILLGDVQVADLDERVLTLAFAKEGDRKGFTSSGCDQVLQESLQHVLGTRWEIRTVTGAADAGSGGAAAASAAEHAAVERDPGESSQPGSAAWTTVQPDHPTGTAASPGAETVDHADFAGTSGGSVHAPDPPSAAAGSGTGPSAEQSARSATNPNAAASAGSRATPDAATDGDGGSIASAASPEPDASGMALIQRELGGEIIEEIDDS